MIAPIKTTDNVKKVRFALSYNPALLEALEVTEAQPSFLSGFGTTYFTAGLIDNQSGTISISEAGLNTITAPVVGGGNIAKVKFRLKGEGTGTLVLTTSDIINTSETVLYNNLPSNASYFVKVLPEDITKDGVVDILDLVRIGRAFGTHPGETGWDPSANIVEDQVIDIFDLVSIAKVFGKTSP